MDSRSRVLKALAHEEPDCVPFNLRPSKEMVERLRKEQGNPNLNFAKFFGHDVRYAYIPIPKCPDGTPLDQWVPGPDPQAIAQCAELTRALQGRGLAVCGGYACGVFEQLKHWYGDVDALTMPYDDPARLGRALEKITDWKIATYGAYAQAGVDIVWIGDDLGMQRGPIMKPDLYRQWYRPCHARIVEALRKIRPDVRIAFHCCGDGSALIPDLIEVGIDVLEAVQAECMDIGALKREFGRDLSFWGGVGAQSILARTTPEEVTEGVRRTLEVMAPGGGYIAAPCHTLTEEVPYESMVAFHEAVKRHRAYPHPGM